MIGAFLEELVDDFLLTRAINQGLHKLLLAHKVPLRDLVNAEHIAKNKHYGVKNVKPEKTQPAKKAPAKKGGKMSGLTPAQQKLPPFIKAAIAKKKKKK